MLFVLLLICDRNTIWVTHMRKLCSGEARSQKRVALCMVDRDIILLLHVALIEGFFLAIKQRMHAKHF